VPIEIRAPEESDLPALFAADGRSFGFAYEADTLDRRRSIMDLSRFRMAVDGSLPVGSSIVGVAGSFALDMTMPGGATVPMGGVTWVSVAATHRRQGLLRRLMEAIHADIDERGEPVAGLGASEGGIYGRFGYGVASQLRRISIDARSARMRPDVVPKPGSVRFMDPDEARLHAADVWERARRARPGETARDAAWWDMTFIDQGEKSEDFSPVFRLRHDDGYAAYRVRMLWNEGAPGHELDLIELVAVTDDAHAALWNTLLGVDLVATITSRRGVALDDPLPYLLDNPRSVRTEGLDDCLWLRPHQPATLLGARTYGTEDRLVIEVVADATESTSTRWQVDGGAEGGSVVRTRRRTDLVLDRAALGAICLGGVRPSVLARGRRLVETTTGTLRRADAFFAAERLPHSQNPF
jgi:predicted acetyltransferase